MESLGGSIILQLLHSLKYLSYLLSTIDLLLTTATT